TPNMITITPRGLSWHRMGVLALATVAAAAAAATTSAGRAAASLTVGTHAMATTAATAPTYRVVQEGLTPADGARLADALGIGNALRPNGAFAYVDGSRFQQLPTTRIGAGR